jgi:EAL domain-containing protein (putative c-di-GMP-specific phosphodiesterase class I)/GGDEF domain-containing protein
MAYPQTAASKFLAPGLFRAELDSTVEQWRAGQEESLFALALVELPRWRLLEPRLGQELAFETMREARLRLEHAVAEQDSFAQYGDAAFGLLLRGLASRQAAKERVGQILGSLGQPFRHGRDEIEIVARAGIAYPESSHANAEALLRDADAALELAKRRKLGFASLPAQRIAPSTHVEVIESELRRAIEQQEIFFEFQPVYDVNSGRIVMLEALSRWRHPRLGEVAPTSFIGAAEDSGLVLELDLAGLRRLAQQLTRWRESGAYSPDILYTINMSGCHFPEFIQEERIFELLQQEPLRGARIAFEITETAFIEGDPVTAGHLQRLRNAGVEIWLDDFGDGHSSIRYLVDFPLNGVKVSEYFVRRAMEEPKARSVLASMRRLAQSLGLDLVAEGVETREQWEMLRNMGYGKVQGYYCSRALSADSVVDAWQSEMLTAAAASRPS